MKENNIKGGLFMIIVAFILWVLIWGMAGYFTVRAIQMHIERKRIAKAMTAMRHAVPAKKITDKDGNVMYSVFPMFDNLSQKE
jgi:hypothetical protein